MPRIDGACRHSATLRGSRDPAGRQVPVTGPGRAGTKPGEQGLSISAGAGPATAPARCRDLRQCRVCLGPRSRTTNGLAPAREKDFYKAMTKGAIGWAFWSSSSAWRARCWRPLRGSASVLPSLPKAVKLDTVVCNSALTACANHSRWQAHAVSFEATLCSFHFFPTAGCPALGRSPSCRSKLQI